VTILEVEQFATLIFSGSGLFIIVALGKGVWQAALLKQTVVDHSEHIEKLEAKVETINEEHLSDHEQKISELRNKDARIDEHLKATDRAAVEQAQVLHEHSIKIADHEVHLRIWESTRK
jgi:hypothetical protein